MKRRIWILTLAAALAWAGAPPLPSTPAGERLGQWLSAINSKDETTIRAFLAKAHPSAPDKGDRAVDLSRNTGGIEALRVMESKPESVTVLVRTKEDGRFAKLTLAVDPGEPHLILDIRIEPAKRPAEFAPTRLGEAEVLAELRKEAEARAGAGQFSGSILVAKNGRTIFSSAYGLADREAKIANTSEMRFRIGSMNKMFTAVAALQLIQAGKLRLEETVGKLLPEYPNREVAAKVTVHHLLTHTGGTGDIFGPEFEKNRLQLKELSDYVKLYGDRGLKFEPGARFDYSNYGFLLLGVIVERVSKETYYDYVEKHIFRPAGMTRTASLAEDEGVKGRSRGYMRGEDGRWTDNRDTLPYRGTSAGGGYSTAEDLGRFAHALLTHKLLDAKHLALLTTGKVNAMGDQYAYGFIDSRTHDGVRSFGHGGGAPGMNGELIIFPDSGYVVVTLANLDPPAAGRLAQFVSDRLPLR